ncbi:MULTISPECIES: class I SAM-dependent methyltransferase [unclassified Brevundimonas]|uniref:class I SAM-dependent methyltransferase n=1 Tax=unclassified Brevundimonas TaxID=2622653 RepID=UPI000CFC33C7|nr:MULTISPECIES: class I SAM-dependent methyltransferase [unclassified Brevundimonas]PRA34826.1 methyltransferase [Brevundimonas sp. MYb27]PQZ83391.1 methyltransferase [Brevundimonas sp. MYb31]PRB14334.1 methyltransferase [Brevundimonas sp. MYb52]PRB35420.1 methyltransferase [Brevundimonas sp. MYb46]PRB54664.1 methyltransferase [Brevundimonas sp. MYb33]
MRSLVLAAILASAFVAPAFAQSTPPESPALQHRQGLSMEMPKVEEDAALQAAIASSARPEADRVRDSQRHPFETLTFWGLQPGLTVVEIEPGRAGWWRNILEPYAAATGGTYVGVGKPTESMGVADGSADMVVVARAFHNWSSDGRTDPYLAAFFKALKPGGVLAVEQHRSVDGLNVADVASTGYVPESYVIHAARRAGFELEARSELNANAKDDRDHPFGVWTLPPTRSSQKDGRVLTAEERAGFDAIGESDRMTLRFRKPEAAN